MTPTAPVGDEAEFLALTTKISRDKGFGCASYKEKCLRRRIAVRMRAKGVHTFGDYARALDSDPREYERLLDALTINVTKLFRNPETYDSIAKNVVPALWALPSSQLRVWSAGCSSGEEPYSLAVLFHRQAETARAVDRVGRVRILGSDIDAASLEAARRGTFEEAAFADTALDLRARYFGGGPTNPIRADVKALVQFERRDLLADPVPGTDFNLVTCRNVIIYFDRATQEALFQRFHSALLPGGFLVLGKVETLLGPARSMFAPVDSRERIFRRL
jgi:chemotaxis methyl-accepting protein methylase